MRGSIDTGGPAFPVSSDVNPDGAQGGMTLRDFFAGQILASGVLDQGDGGTVIEAAEEIAVENYDVSKHWPILRAKRAYQAADAMIEARKEQS